MAEEKRVYATPVLEGRGSVRDLTHFQDESPTVTDGGSILVDD